MNTLSARFRKLGPCALIFFVTLLAYWPALRGGFVWDDNAHVTRPDLRSLAGLHRIWFELGATQQYYPLLHSAFWLEHRLWGDAPLGYHLVNLLLHALAACLVVTLMRRLALPGALLGGLIFALHPVGVESVAWISEQKNTLSAVFALGAAICYLDFDRDRRGAQYGVALGLFLLALLTKSVTATLPAVLLVIFWWQRGKIEWRRDVQPLLPWLALGLTAGIFTAWVERKFIGAEGPDFALSLVERCLLAGRVTWFYLGKLAWPADLIFIYPHWNVSASESWQYLFPAGVLLLIAGLVVAARRRRGPLAGFLIFAGTIFPALGFLNVYPFVYSYVADHFQYLASLGLIVPVAASLAGSRLATSARPLALVAGGLLALTLGVLTWRQCGMYHDTLTLYRETLARNPGSAMAHNGLGEILLHVPGRRDEAVDHLQTSVRLNPRNAEAHNNLGYAYAQDPARLSDAVAEYEAALKIRDGFMEAHNNLALVLEKIPGRLPDAITHFKAAVRLNPEAADIHNNLGVALARMPGSLPEATAEFAAAARLDPTSAEIQANLGSTLAQDPGRLPEAVQHLEAALGLDPDSAQAQNNLGAALGRIPGRESEAIPHFEAALRGHPEFADAHFGLGVALAAQPSRRAEALAHLEEALRLRPDDEEARQWIARVRAAAP